MGEVKSKWSIEKDLIKLSKQSNLQTATIKLGLLNEGENLGNIKGAASWVLGGSETYIYPFSVISEDGLHRNFILKAVTAFSPANSLDEILAEWITRRKLLEDSGVRAPRLHFAGEGVVLEEFIPYALKDVLQRDLETDHLIHELFEYASTLSKLGFVPIAAFDDLRTDHTHIFVIDFGEDLGPAHQEEPGSMNLYWKALEWLNKCGLVIEDEQSDILKANYMLNSTINSSYH
jgi:hypothetical protein